MIAKVIQKSYNVNVIRNAFIRVGGIDLQWNLHKKTY